MVQDPVRTSIVGVGLGGLTFHVPYILGLPKLFTLHSVVERNPQGLGKAQERFPNTQPPITIVRNFDEVLEDPDVELVIISTPNTTHYEMAKRALTAGKHVLVDKPITVTSAEARELGELAKSKGKIAYAFQNRRWDADFLALKRLITAPGDSNLIGTLTELESHYDRFRLTPSGGAWKDEPLPGAGQLYNLGTHLIDQVLCLFGRPHKLTAFLQNLRGVGHPDNDDCFTIHLHYPKGPERPYPLSVIMRAHPLSARSPQLRFIARGTKGTYTKFGVDVQEDQLKALSSPHHILDHEQLGKEPKELWGFIENLEGDRTVWPSTEPGSYISLFKNLGAAIRGNEEPMVKWEEATAVIEIVELALKSSKEGVTVDVPSL